MIIQLDGIDGTIWAYHAFANRHTTVPPEFHACAWRALYSSETQYDRKYGVAMTFDQMDAFDLEYTTEWRIKNTIGDWCGLPLQPIKDGRLQVVDHYLFIFELQEDATIFKLRWA